MRRRKRGSRNLAPAESTVHPEVVGESGNVRKPGQCRIASPTTSGCTGPQSPYAARLPSPRCIAGVALWFAAAFLACGAPFERNTASDQRTALDRYVAAPDTNYTWHLVKTIPGQGYQAFVLEMTSQAWLTTNEVNRTLWKHWLTIIQPETVTTSSSLLFISGGSNGRTAPNSADPRVVRAAITTQSIVAELKMVPNQPLIFAGETKGRTEDSLIAYTWDKFMRGGDENWPARLPSRRWPLSGIWGKRSGWRAGSRATGRAPRPCTPSSWNWRARAGSMPQPSWRAASRR